MSDISPELHAEQERRELYDWLKYTLQDYQEVFDLPEDDLKDKKILEIGACDRRVAAALMINKLTNEIYSLDPAYIKQQEGYADTEVTKGVVERLPQDLQEEIKKRTVSSTAEETPFNDQSFDLVIGRSVNFDSPEQLVKRLKELLRVGNEVRLYPVVDEDRSIYDAALGKVREELNIQVEFKTIIDEDIETDSGTRHVKEDVLILRKK